MSKNFADDNVIPAEKVADRRIHGSRSASDGAAGPSSDGLAPRKPLKLSTVSHTLNSEVAERLRHFAFRERISESAVIEFALRAFFEGGNDAKLGAQLRERGAGLRRKS